MYKTAWPFRGDPSSGHAVEIAATYSASKPSQQLSGTKQYLGLCPTSFISGTYLSI